MIIANHKPILIVGYTASSMTHEFENAISKTHEYTVIEPNEYLTLKNPDRYQYIVASWIDMQERKNIITHIDHQNLDLVTYIDDTAVVGKMPATQIDPGTFIFPFCNIELGSHVGSHSILSSYTLIGHYVTIGCGCITRPGVIIVGKSQVGKNCTFNTRSTVTNQAVICDNVNVMGFSSVTKNINQPGQYAGTPARRISD